MAFATLPFETNGFIIELLATEDDALFSSIKSCSLVSHCLLPHTRKHIFKVITLKPKDDHQIPAYTPLRFARLISRTPEVAQYIHTLDYTVAERDSNIEGLAAALGSLTMLNSLKLATQFGMHWKYMPFPETLLKLMHLPTLTHLKSSIRTFPISNLTLCTGLKFLEAGDLNWMGEKIELYQEQPPRLETLGYVQMPNNSREMLKTLCTARRTDGKAAVDISGLKKLFVYVQETPEEDTQEFFTHCTHLVDVYLAGCESLLPGLGFANLFRPSIRTLQHIHIEFSVLQDNQDPLPQLAPEFASLTGNNIIESVKIMVFICLPTDYFSPGDEWDALDSVFTHSESGWAKLQRLSLYISVMWEDSEDEAEELLEALCELPETRLTGLAASDTFLFDFNVLSESQDNF